MGDAVQVAPGVRALAFHASGATQHVFVDPVGPRVAVYKVPALVDALLPADPVRAVGRSSRVVRTVAGVAPGRLAVAAVLRWRRRQAFGAMIGLLGALQEAGCGDVVPPFAVLDGRQFQFRLPAGVLRYRGPVLRQARVDFLETGEDLQRLDREALVARQERLWRAGFGVADAAGAFGPDGWGVLDGQLVLADTGSLTRGPARAAAVISADRLLSFRERRMRRAADPASLADYYDFVGRRINPGRMAACWRREAE